MLEAIMKRTTVRVKPRAITYEMVDRVWQKGSIINGHSPQKYRQDACGAWIMREKYGHTDSSYGWVIDNINQEYQDVSAIGNLRPLQWENMKGKKDGELVCIVAANGNKNT